MARRISFATLCITLGLLMGLVLTGRLKSAEESSAADQAASAPAPRPTAAVPATAGLPDLTGVANGSSAA